MVSIIPGMERADPDRTETSQRGVTAAESLACGLSNAVICALRYP